MTTLQATPSRTLVVALGERSYPIHIGAALLNGIGELLPKTRSKHAVIVTNPIVADRWLQLWFEWEFETPFALWHVPLFTTSRKEGGSRGATSISRRCRFCFFD